MGVRMLGRPVSQDQGPHGDASCLWLVSSAVSLGLQASLRSMEGLGLATVQPHAVCKRGLYGLGRWVGEVGTHLGTRLAAARAALLWSLVGMTLVAPLGTCQRCAVYASPNPSPANAEQPPLPGDTGCHHVRGRLQVRREDHAQNGEQGPGPKSGQCGEGRGLAWPGQEWPPCRPLTGPFFHLCCPAHPWVCCFRIWGDLALAQPHLGWWPSPR